MNPMRRIRPFVDCCRSSIFQYKVMNIIIRYAIGFQLIFLKMNKTSENLQQQPKDQNPKSASLNKQKQKYEWVFKVVYLLITIFSAILFNKMYLFQTLPEFDNVRKGTLKELIIYAVPFCIVFTFFDQIIHKLFDKKCQEHYITLEKYQDPKAKTKRSYTLVKWMYSLVYYLISSVAGYLLIKDTSYFPTWLGGSGHCLNFYTNAPELAEATLAMKVFYIIQFGKHLSRMLSHMFLHQEGNYYEYILHHALSIFLIGFSFLMNMWLIGILVLLIHDLSDFFLISARAYRDYRHYSKNFLKVIYVLAVAAWIGCRLVIFNICCVYSGLYGAFYYVPQFLNEIETEIMWYSYLFMSVMMAALEVLHLFWTYYIFSSFISVNVSEKMAKHNYD